MDARNQHGYSALLWRLSCLRFDNTKRADALIGALIDAGADVNRTLHNAYSLREDFKLEENEFEKLSDLLLERGADINARDENGMTVLHKAYKKGVLDAGSYVLDKGADVNARNDDGVTPLHMALQSGCSYKAAISLIERGADVIAKDNDGNATMDYAVFFCNRETAEMVVDAAILKGADINARDIDNGTTVLHAAAGRESFDESVELAHFLVGKGADPRIGDFEGDRPSDYARANGTNDLAVFLESKEQELDAKEHAAAMMERARTKGMQGSRGRDMTL